MRFGRSIPPYPGSHRAVEEMGRVRDSMRMRQIETARRTSSHLARTSTGTHVAGALPRKTPIDTFVSESICPTRGLLPQDTKLSRSVKRAAKNDERDTACSPHEMFSRGAHINTRIYIRRPLTHNIGESTLRTSAKPRKPC